MDFYHNYDILILHVVEANSKTDYCLLTCFMAILLSLCLGISSLLCNTFYQLMITRKKKCHHVRLLCACVNSKEAGRPLHLNMARNEGGKCITI